VAAATLLFCLNPLSTALAARLLTGVRLTPNQWLAIALGLSSVLTLKFDFLVGPAAGSGSTGVAMGLISAATFSGYFITGQSIRKKLGNLGYTSVVYSITVVCSAVALGASGEPFLGWTTPTWLAFVALAVFPTLLGHALMTHCLPSLNINWASTMTLIEPVLAAVTASWIFGESISSGFALASALGLAAVWVLFRGVNT
jgi:drug/metabolite transporter (DMT)-like permease